jgi:hypothetical protein
MRNKANSKQVGRGRPTLDQVEGRFHEEAIMRNKAKPGCPGVSGGQDGGTSAGQMRQTNPIRGRPTGPFHSSIPLFQHSSPMPSCETKPIPDRAGWDGASGTRDERAKQSRFPALSGGTGPGGTWALYKQSQFPAGGTGMSSAELSRGRIAPNKPNLPPMGGEDHRQDRRS